MKTQDLRERYRVGSGHGNVLPGIARLKFVPILAGVARSSYQAFAY